MAEAIAETIPCDLCQMQVTLDDWISHAVGEMEVFYHDLSSAS